MSKPIELNDALKNEIRDEMFKLLDKFNPEELRKEILEGLSKARMSDGKFKFLRELKYEKAFKYDSTRRVTVKFTPEAYAKMLTIIMSQDKEVGWHGITERLSKTEFLIKDILVYPQTVTAVTVDTDDEEYTKWMIKLGMEKFNSLHFHGHSHVNMGVGPSPTDMGHRNKIVNQLGDKDFYIFMIWNKKLEFSGAVYDRAANTLYDSEDIDVQIMLGDMTAGDLVRDLKEKVVQKVSTYSSYPKGNVTPLPATYQGKEDKKDKKEKKGGSGIGNDPDNFHYGRYPYPGSYNGYYYDY